MSNSFEIYKTMVASTAHCEQYDFDAFRVYPDIFSCEDHGYGMSIYLGAEHSILSDLSLIRISEGLKMLVLFAVSNDCLWLKLDQDGPIYKKFPVYDW
tara:strand:- start:1729 stop:2022 length:294 start_codon:yes stop_codon:yes gene_type:complete